MIQVGKGRSSVRITGSLADGIEKELRAALGPVADAMLAEATRIRDQAKTQWPVKSGKSRDSMQVGFRILPDSLRVEAMIFSANPYIYKIRSTKVGTSKDATRIRQPWLASVKMPATKAKKELISKIHDLIAKSMQAGFGGK